MRFVVGLGNPGAAYVRTRHNIGAEVVAALARDWKFVFDSPHDHVRAAYGIIDGTTVVLIQPQTFMNRSGEALVAMRGSFEPEELIVVHDELDLAYGTVRVKAGGGAGGHHGVESVIAQMGADFTRIRVGIGRPPTGVDRATYVLSEVNEIERQQLSSVLESATAAVRCVIQEGEAAAMNRFNVRPRRSEIIAG